MSSSITSRAYRPLPRWIVDIIEHEASGWDKQNNTVIANAVRALIPSLSTVTDTTAPSEGRVQRPTIAELEWMLAAPKDFFTCEIEPSGATRAIPGPRFHELFPSATVPPINMLLFCPRCQHQHVDAPQPEQGWTNPPHATHTCQKCGLLWRPSNALTNGVASIEQHEPKHAERIAAAFPVPIARGDDPVLGECEDCGHTIVTPLKRLTCDGDWSKCQLAPCRESQKCGCNKVSRIGYMGDVSGPGCDPDVP